MILILLALLVLWVAAGMVLFIRNSPNPTGYYHRTVAKRVYTVGEGVTVSLNITPPRTDIKVNDHDVLLAIDHSSSMGGGPGSPLRESIRAAENFINRLPANIQVGVVAFDHEARLLSPVTGDKQQSSGALTVIGPGGGTAIHLALDRCREALRDTRTGVRKTVILLSDGGSNKESAELAAARLRQETPDASILCIGFGQNVSESLMLAVADSPDQYIHIQKASDIYAFFSRLAALISGQDLAAGRIEEMIWSPHPFRLTGINGLYPTGVRSENPTGVYWSVPVASEDSIRLNYVLIPDCPGWHSVAAPESRLVWQTTNGREQEYSAPGGPRVLVLAWWMRWLWPIFNPLFWMIFGRWWPCLTPEKPAESLAEVKPLPLPSFPALLPASQERPYELKLRPALVIGLGEVGEWTVCRFKDRLRDRGLDASQVEVVTIHASHWLNRPLVQIGRTTIDPEERIELQQDLRPYLESLRTNGSPFTRQWIPLREWLSDMKPLTTLRAIADDRRKARLAILQKAVLVEQKLRAGLARIAQSEIGTVIIVGSAHDPECSGMMAEIAHICAEKNTSITAVFAPSLMDQEPSTAVLALAQELERMTLMSGRRIVSDRQIPAVSAKQLFDQIIVLEQQGKDVKDASIPAAEWIWCMLAYDAVSKKLLPRRKSDREVMCYGVKVNGQALPAISIWDWVREQTLSRGINRERLGLQEKQERLVLPAIRKDEIENDVEAFWTARNSTRPVSLFIANSRPLLNVINSGSTPMLVGLQDHLPFDSPYHEQVAFSHKERQQFANYLEAWSHNILEREQKKGAWGLQPLLAALLRIESDLKMILGNVNRSSGNISLAGVVSLASSLYLDFLNIIAELRGDLSQWMAIFTGPQLELNIDSSPDGRLPICYDIEQEKKASEKGLDLSNPKMKELLERRFEEWYDSYGHSLLGQLHYFVRVEGSDHLVRLRLRLDEKTDTGSSDNLIDFLRETLNRYRNVVLSWPLDHLLMPENLPNPLDRFRVGKHSGRLYPKVSDVADDHDPFTAAAIQLRERPLREALAVATPLHGEMPYTWPEEANAARIAEKVRNRLNLAPQPFAPRVIHLLGDPQKLYGFLSDLGQGRIRNEGTSYVLKRNGKDYSIGPTSDALKGLDAFHNIAEQVVSYEAALNGERIDPPFGRWTVGPEEAVRAVESHPLAAAALSSPDWQMWRDVIRGLALEQMEL